MFSFDFITMKLGGVAPRFSHDERRDFFTTLEQKEARERFITSHVAKARNHGGISQNTERGSII